MEAALNSEAQDLIGEALRAEEEERKSLLALAGQWAAVNVSTQEHLTQKVGLMTLPLPGSWTRNMKVKVSQTMTLTTLWATPREFL